MSLAELFEKIEETYETNRLKEVELDGCGLTEA